MNINVIVALIQTHNKECSQLSLGVLYVIAGKESQLLHGGSTVNNFFVHRRRRCSGSEKKVYIPRSVYQPLHYVLAIYQLLLDSFGTALFN
jgi:hypothetical protein